MKTMANFQFNGVKACIKIFRGCRQEENGKVLSLNFSEHIPFKLPLNPTIGCLGFCSLGLKGNEELDRLAKQTLHKVARSQRSREWFGREQQVKSSKMTYTIRLVWSSLLFLESVCCRNNQQNIVLSNEFFSIFYLWIWNIEIKSVVWKESWEIKKQQVSYT